MCIHNHVVELFWIFWILVKYQVDQGLRDPKQNVTLVSGQIITTSVSLLSLLSILPIRAILPWRPHGTHGPWWSRGSGVPRRPCWAWETADELWGEDGDVGASLGRGIHGLGEDNWQQTGHHTYLEHDGHCRATRYEDRNRSQHLSLPEEAATSRCFKPSPENIYNSEWRSEAEFKHVKQDPAKNVGFHIITVSFMLWLSMRNTSVVSGLSQSPDSHTQHVSVNKVFWTVQRHRKITHQLRNKGDLWAVFSDFQVDKLSYMIFQLFWDTLQ